MSYRTLALLDVDGQKERCNAKNTHETVQPVFIRFGRYKMTRIGYIPCFHRDSNCFPGVSISNFRTVCFDPKNGRICSSSPNMQNRESDGSRILSEYTTLDCFFFGLRFRSTKSSEFGPKSDDLGSQISKSKRAWCLNSIELYHPREQEATEY